MVKVAVVGCGRWGMNLVRNFAHAQALAAVCCVHHENAAQAGQLFHVPVCDFAQLLKEPEISGIVLATHTHTHFDLAREALQAGKHVYVEKPVALCARQAQELADLAQEKDLVLMAGHLLQYHPAFLLIQEKVQAGLIGPIHTLHTRRLFMGRIRASENVIWDLLPHDLSMVLGLVASPVVQVQAAASAGFGSSWDTVSAVLAFEDGAQAYLNASWSFPLKEQTMVVVGQSGALCFDDTADWPEKVRHLPLTATPGDGDDIWLQPGAWAPLPVNPAEPLAQECQHFLDCMQQAQSCRTGPPEFMPVMHLCQQIHDKIGVL